MWSELPVTCHISGASMTSYLVITGMLIHRYKRFGKIMEENRFSEEDDDNTYRYYIAATTLTGLAVSFPMIWEIWNCITKQHQSINYRCGPLFISINMISICLLFFIVCNIWTSIRLKNMIEFADETANQTLNVQRRTDTKRIKATRKLSYLLFASWIIDIEHQESSQEIQVA